MKTYYTKIHFYKLIALSIKSLTSKVFILLIFSLVFYATTSRAIDLSGNLNAIDTLKLVDSPFTVITNIYFTSGTHVIEPGVVLMFNPNTGFEIGQANVKCEGTVTDSIVFTSTGGTVGTWNGVYFSNYSDNGVSSTMSYTRIEKAGNGTWNSNLYCANTIMPNISYSSFVEADGNGVRLDYSPRTMSDCIMESNITGLNIYYPNGTITTYLNNCTIQNNTNTGFRCNTFIELTNSLITNNTVYEVDAFAPNGFPLLNNSFIQEDGTSINRIGGGIQSVDRTWPYNSNGYEITGVVYIYQSAAKPRLTINAGSTLRFETAGKIFVGNSSSYGGELHALGTVDSVITFTALNPAGNWEGIQFSDGSDSYSASSSMQYCTVEKGNSYNVYCINNYNAVVFDNCEFNNAAGEGIEMYNAAITVNNSLFQNNHTGLSLTSSNVNFITYLDNCTIQNNTNTGIRSNLFIELTNSLITNNNVYEVDAFAPNGFPLLTNSSILEDATSMNRVGAGTQTVDRIWPYNSNGYEVTGVVNINLSASKPRLTIKAGSTLRFEAAGKIIVGNSSSYGGELHALGTVDSVITFTALNPAGNWEGIHFNDGSDSYGATCSMQHCVIDKGNSYNVYCSNTSQPPVIKDGIISNSAGIGLSLYNSSTNLEKCQVINNVSYGIYINGNSNITIGNSPTKICDLYYNGEYDVYNNSTNYIPAGSNFWNTSDTGLISKRIYDKNDEFLKGLVYHYPIKQSGFITKDKFNISGKVIYNNIDSTEINGMEISAMNMQGNIISTTTTNATGDYSFTSLENAQYLFSGTGVAWGGSNSTDALAILQHFAFINPLSGLNLAAADVNGSGGANGSDALMVLQRFAAMTNSFPAGDWVLSDSATLYGSDTTINHVASCYGDVNGTYTPPGKEVSSVQLIADGSIGITSFEEYEIPIKIKNNLEIGALSLVLTYPEEFLDISEIIMADGSPNLIYSASGGFIKNAWANLDPIILEDQELLLTVKSKPKT